MDILSNTACTIVPGTIPWGPGWYLVSEDNRRVEAGPFATDHDAELAAGWLEDSDLGVHPLPYQARQSPVGLVIGSRIRDRKGSLQLVR
jgi:hypothetical protein